MTEDTEPYSGITYYRLNTIESNGKTNNYKIIDIDRANKNWKSLLYQIDNNLIIEFKNAIPKEAQVMLFDLSGQQIAERNIEQLQTKINIDNLSTGIYFVRITSPYKIENFKIIIQK
jgi:regulatory protein YycH of two-component signal transduction system YycFG